VLLALWMYRKLPLAGKPPRPVRPAYRVLGFGLFALTMPIALHCLIAYGVQLTPARVAVHSLAGCFLYGAFVAKVLLVHGPRSRVSSLQNLVSSSCRAGARSASRTPRKCPRRPRNSTR
jgi:hypothetical protein